MERPVSVNITLYTPFDSRQTSGRTASAAAPRRSQAAAGTRPGLAGGSSPPGRSVTARALVRSASSGAKALISGADMKRRAITPSSRQLAAAVMLMPRWWAITQRTARGPSGQRAGVKSTASQRPNGPSAPRAAKRRRFSTASRGQTQRAR